MKFQKSPFPLFAIITTAAVAFSIFLLNTQDKAPTASEVTTRSLLFVYEGENAELEPIGDSGTEFTLSVPIASKESRVTWFTDRPNRDAGHMSYENFVKLFYSNVNDGFKIDPPNVAIQLEGTTLIAEMTEPKIISGTNNAESIIAAFTLVSGSAKDEMVSEKSFIASHVSKSDDVKSIGSTRTLDRVSIFVDDVGMTTIDKIMSGPITNTSITRVDRNEIYFPPLYYYNGDFPFSLPDRSKILGANSCEVFVNGNGIGYQIFYNGNPASGNSLKNAFSASGNSLKLQIIYNEAQPVDQGDPPKYKGDPPTYENYTFTLQCKDLLVDE